jgi:hypothetical protein
MLEYLQSKWQISDPRINTQIGTETTANVKVELGLKSVQNLPLNPLPIFP